ncbi:porin family protein [Mucilaginibacter aquaedulcis]|uniref:porin family protein n=1 Tax=Mucilaginibacter aquaedulcis TaxID=1187081 RepID=UPI0025B52FF1|nr:porin family protein [Mucilaginibacter aquaedulcis]MDN3550873.1 porin family protein [Mucilaginibacter aquaedulcis]
MRSLRKASSYAHFVFKIASVLFLTTTFSIFTSSTLIAQNREEAKSSGTTTDTLNTRFEIGVSGGVNLNRFTKGQPQTGFNTGYNGGISVNYHLYKQLSLQLEANYLQQGGQMISFKDDTRYGLPESFSTKNVKNSSFKLNSIEVPLLINYSINTKQSWIPTFYAGASYAYSFNVTENYQKTGDLLTGEDIIATVTGKQNVSGLFNSYRFNFITGANVKLPLTSKFKLLLDFRYLTGLSTAREGYSYMEKAGFGSNIRTNSFITKIGIVMAVK